MIPLQDMQGIQNDDLIMSMTGLAGGILNNGSTCGVVIGSAISSTIIRDRELEGQWTPEDEIQLLEEIRNDVDWFEERFGTCLCREREEDRYQRLTVIGLLNPRKVRGCVARTGASMTHLMEKYEAAHEPRPQTPASTAIRCEHCAQKILRDIRLETGVGNEHLEQISIALDGGIGLSGGGCGALSGALMALGLKYALDPGQTDPKQLRNIYRSMDSVFFSQSKKLVSRFIKNFEYFECSRLTGQSFQDWNAFCQFRSSSSCDAINQFLVEETVKIIQGSE